MAQGSYLLIGVTIINILITVRMRERNLDLSEYVHKGCTVRCKNLMGYHDQSWSSSWILWVHWWWSLCSALALVDFERAWIVVAAPLVAVYHKWQRNFFLPNLIFWIVKGCGKARFSCRWQKTPKIENYGHKICSLGPRGVTVQSRDMWSHMNTIPFSGARRIWSISWRVMPRCHNGFWDSALFLSLRLASRSHVAAPWAPIAACLEVSYAARLEVPGNKLWDQNFQF